MATKIERLLFKRKRLIADIARQATIISTFTEATSGAIQISRKEALEELWSEYKLNNDVIESSREWVGTDIYIQEHSDVHEQYLEALTKLLETMPEQTEALQTSLFAMRNPKHRFNSSRHDMSEAADDDNVQEDLVSNPDVDAPPQNTAAAASQQNMSTPRSTMETVGIKLPPLNIKKFSGSLIDWPEFKATCKSTFAQIKDETNRFSYFKGFLEGEPAQMVKYLPVAATSYDRAFNMLNDRYNNERAIINANLQRLVDLPYSERENVDELKTMLNTANACVEAINSYEISTKTWSCILVFLLSQRLDSTSIRHWEESLKGRKTVPAYAEFIEFLDVRIAILESTRPVSKSDGQQKVFLNADVTKKCTICQDSLHFAYLCPQLRALRPSEREPFIKKRGLCINCFHGHNVETCSSRYSCRICLKRHNTVLHVDEKVNAMFIDSLETQAEQEIEPEELQAREMMQSFVGHVNSNMRHSHVMLATALVKIVYNNRTVYARALLDQGSTTNLVTERICKALHLVEKPINLPIMGICDTVTHEVKNMATFTLKSTVCESYVLATTALIVPKITTLNQQFDQSDWPHLTGIQLADPQINQSQRIDILLGAAVYADIILEGLLKGSSGQPVAQNTQLGWIISGGIERFTFQTPVFTIQTASDCLSECLTKFWEAEEVPLKRVLSDNEQLAENIYVSTTKRCDDGRYMVKLPFKSTDGPDLGQSFMIAKRRYDFMRKRYESKPEFTQIYNQCIQQYVDLGHMELADSSKWPYNYLPHHPVIKEASSTTKVRPVFDASCKTGNGKSLNSELLIGPTIQSDLFSLLLRWRKNRIAISGDIEQMYRQVWIYPEDRDFQRILWRPEGATETKSYRLKTVTFGVAAAPFLAIRTLFKIADDIKSESPQLAEKIKEQFYVDDFFDSLETVEEAKTILKGMSETLAQYGFILRKWKSNDETTLNHLQPKEKEVTQSNVFKTLGIQWQPSTDEFLFKPVELKESRTDWTKRLILSDISKLFDPLGWLSPCIVLAKIFMQRLWLLQVGWDDHLPADVTNEWLLIRSQFVTSCAVKIPRWIGYQKDIKHVSLQGFSDASEKSCAGVVYIRIVNMDGSITCQLLAAKTRVAPIKTMTIPRLELKAAVLLASLLDSVKSAIKIPSIKIQAWSDSTIVLYWLADHASRWKTFVSNRVKEVHEKVPSHSWKYVDTKNNAADCASRGLERRKLEISSIWWKGPEFLSHPECEWPKYTPIIPKDANLEEKKRQPLVGHVTVDKPELSSETLRFSNYDGMLKAISICLRWVPNGQFLKRSLITPSELDHTEKILVRQVQAEVFGKEIEMLRNGKTLPLSHPIRPLDPFVDHEALLRVGGRIQLANLNENEKHPMILPSKHHFTTILIRHMHDQAMHGGLALTLQKIRQRFWIISARTTVTSVIHKCLTCFRFKKLTVDQKMGNLPAYRVCGNEPFTYCGIDYAGYFQVKSSARKNAPYFKAYIALFICLTTRMIHLELVSDCSTTNFLKALKRFIGRRSLPSFIFSDNASNFVGAAHEIQLSLEQALNETKSEFRQTLLEKRITWSTIPPRAPHFGGWESGVKLVNELAPLWAMPTKIDEFKPLTPGHFAVFRPLNALPEANLDHVPLNRLTQYQYLNRLLSDFWKLWSKEYIHSLQARKKWIDTKPNVKVGQIVLLTEDNQRPTEWALGKIVAVITGDDGLVRVADVKVADSEKGGFKCKVFRRSIHKLSLLPILDNNQSE